MKKFSSSKHTTMNELNITPLLDLAFVLLVIFIITTPQMSNDLEMNLPSPKKNEAPTTPPKINRVIVSEAGDITFNLKPVQLPELKRALIQLRTEDTNTSVVVFGHMNVDYQKVIGVLDILQQADISKVGLATETVQ
jgi:biopolymer transport protein ExbD